MTQKIKKLPSELINQIAAGEVVERPASVIKELVDNSIDAGATQIKIKVKNGGIDLIEVSDNGSGISKDDLPLAFERHATSKISSIEDLNSLLTMGFRGEALSTIVSISNLSISSKTSDSDDAYELTFNGIEPNDLNTVARDVGTTVSVENIFHNIPARQKFLKTAETEYRNMLDILIPFFLAYPNIHFTLEKNSNIAYNLPIIPEAKAGQIHQTRVNEVLKGDFTTEMMKLFYDGDGVKISGLIAHPKYHTKRTRDQYMFVNDRPISDKGIYRAVHEGYGRFIPKGEKMQFIIKIAIRPDLVDVNVHPRKEEVRFMNPYRLYSAVENAVNAALEKEMKEDDDISYYTESVDSTKDEFDNAVSRLRPSLPSGESYSERIRNERPQASAVQDSLNFSQAVLREDIGIEGPFTGDKIDFDEQDISTFKDKIRNAFQIFNKYIVLELIDELWIIDQHAAAERITFEKLNKHYEEEHKDVQELLVVAEVILSDQEKSFVIENREFFEKLGFSLTESENGIEVSSVPAEFMGVDINMVFNSIFTDLTEDQRNLEKDFKQAKEDILATVACHSSIRTKQALKQEECISLALQLLECDNPYSCPHGRPIVWKQSLSQLDANFDRTY